MSALEDLPAARTAIRLRHHRELVTLDQRRALLELVAAGATASDIAALLKISQSAVAGLLQRAEGTPPALEGFSGATPLEVAQRYAAGLIPREQVVAELVAFPYTPMPALTGREDPLMLPPGTWADLSEAHTRGLIDIDIYDEVHSQLRANRTATTAQRSLTADPVEPAEPTVRFRFLAGADATALNQPTGDVDEVGPAEGPAEGADVGADVGADEGADEGARTQ